MTYSPGSGPVSLTSQQATSYAPPCGAAGTLLSGGGTVRIGHHDGPGSRWSA